jgi:hypothetical protein
MDNLFEASATASFSGQYMMAHDDLFFSAIATIEPILAALFIEVA